MLKLQSFCAVAALVVAAGCSTPSGEQDQILSTYLENAAQYYDGGHYDRAYQQWDQALALDGSNEKARFGQAMALYQMGRAESPKALEPLSEGTRRLEELRQENYGEDQWKVELGVGLVHERWCEIYDRQLRLIEEQEKHGVPPDEGRRAIARREFARHLDVSEAALASVLTGPEREPRDRLSCWLALARISAWRGDLTKCLDYTTLYLEQVMRSKKLWKDSAERYPTEAPIYKAKYTGAEMQEAELRDLRGAAFFKLGRLDDAETELNHVITMFPQRAAAYLNRGIVRQTRGDDDLARGDYKQFLNYTDLPDTDLSILEVTRRMKEVEERLAEPPPGQNGPAVEQR